MVPAEKPLDVTRPVPRETLRQKKILESARVFD